MTRTPRGIDEVGTVFVPVTDQERSLSYYLGRLGFEKRLDFAYGGAHRWVEVAPPGASHRLALVPPGEGMSPGGDIARCAFETADIESAHETLRDRGADVDEVIAGSDKPRAGLVSLEASVEDPVPPQFFLRDPDGNRFLVVQTG